MGLFKKLGKLGKKVGKAIGKGWEKVDDFALPALGFALGGPGGAALGAAAARGIGDGKFDPKATALAGAKGYVGGQVAGGLGLKGGQGLKMLGGSARSALSNPGTLAMNAGRSVMGGGAPVQGGTPGAPMDGGGGRFDTLKRIGGGILDNSDLILGGLSAYEAQKQGARADKMSQAQLDFERQQYAERAPLRQLGMQGLLAAPPQRRPLTIPQRERFETGRSLNPFG